MVLIPLAINHVDPMIKETWKQEGNNGSINTQQYSVALGQPGPKQMPGEQQGYLFSHQGETRTKATLDCHALTILKMLL